MPRLPALFFLAFGLMLSPSGATAADCALSGNKGLAVCDRDGDGVANSPQDPSLWRDPETLVWAFAPIEDPSVYAELLRPFSQHLATCLDRQIVYYPVQSNAAEIAAMRSGRLHFAGFSTGPTVAAVRQAGAVPFAAKGSDGRLRGYQLMAIVRASSPFQTLSDLKGHRVAHESPSSNSGNHAPRALFPDQGLVPGQDYTPLMSGGHDLSILGVVNGDYDMAAVASDVLQRMIERGVVDEADLRILYESPPFPTSSFAYAHDLAPALADRLKRCFFSFRFTPQMQAAFHGDEAFVPIRYDKDWAVVRAVIEGSQAGTF
ncbi:phosphate/phosphite/phosphonate ABC transporter substrate-binding protein [Aureimonas frigidaquae]|uniref:Phosphate/phosphite/phosphonate ABC transporter substrate-binding protein n=1 Tax=Aureimonas frigidaquae TaxID=424757 RepID=A0A0P0Z3J5_9HYPH|nr:phosphate/phosphite/phosphonate ABC transporter substrate-binding protein [Aureimonas frigidaquae]BAT28559.1 hypothetical protein [Aureimonas frigidaquae]